MRLPQYKKLLWVTLFLVTSAYPAWSCESLKSNQWLKPLKVKSDCSFEDAGRGSWGHGSGGAVVDLGGGKIAQRVTSGPSGCYATQHLVFQNCQSDVGLVVDGVLDPDFKISGATYTYIRLIQKPKGPIGLTSTTTVEELKKIAVKNGYSWNVNLREFFRENSKLKRIDYTCGCKLYYPDSPGAKL